MNFPTLVAAVLLGPVLLSGGPSVAAGWHNSLAPRGQHSSPLTLARDGETDYVIVIPAQPTSQDNKAAEDLARWLGEMTGAEFRIVPDSAPAIATEISVGRTNRLAKAEVPQAAAGLGDEGYAIGAHGARLFLLGGRLRGPIYAVYALLEEDLGCRWYAGESSRLPHRRTLRLRPVPRAYTPPLLIRDPFYFAAFNPTWSLRNRTNAPRAPVPEEWGGHVDYDGLFVHTFNQLVPPDQYFKNHPEYFALVDGQRTLEQLCLTNPEVVKIATANVLRVLEEHPNTEIVEVSANDNDSHCTCPACARIDAENGSPAGSLITFVNQVAAAVEKAHPGVWVSTLAYQHTVDAPTRVRPRQNVVVRLCNNFHAGRYPFVDFVSSDHPESKRYRQEISAWSAICNQLTIWDYTANFGHYLAPLPNMQVLAPSVRYYVAHKVKGVMLEGTYQGAGGERMEMRSWVMAKLLWDPTREVEELTRDFVQGYYEEAAPAIFAYYELLDRAGSERPEVNMYYNMDAPFLSREFLDQATALFDRAEALARSDEIRRRVQLARLPIIYVKLCQGPEFTGPDRYRSLIAEFEKEARRENVVFTREGSPNLDLRLQEWRTDLSVSERLSDIKPSEVEVWPLPAVWRFAIDPEDVGGSKAWYGASFNDADWAEVRSDRGNGWDSQGFPGYTGFGWYRQTIAVPASLDRKYLYLYFGAVDEEAWVYLNGQLAFEHSCATTGLTPAQIWATPFAFDPRSHLKLGEANTIAVRVYNSAFMGGIYLPVYLVAADRPLDVPLAKAVVAREAPR